jgi:hypothetical protein
MRADEYRREIEDLKSTFKIQIDQAKENAHDCSKGCDELYIQMTKSVETAYQRCKKANEEQVKAAEEVE